MTIQIKHAFTSAKGDGGDATLVRPSNWNAAHTTSMATLSILGRLTAGTGVFEELPATAFMIAALNSADKAALIAALGIGVFDTGDVKFSVDPTAAAGWIAYNGEGTISKAASGGTVRANADCLALWIIAYVNIADAFCPVSGGRTGSDATAATNDFNAGKTMGLPRFSGRTIIGAGTGATLTARAAGAYGGEEAHTITVGEMPSHNHGGVTGVMNSNQSHTHSYTYPLAGAQKPNGTGTTPADVGGTTATGATNIDHTHNITSQGGGGAANVMQPYTPMWAKVKL